jgi:exodeoxyribonuclease VII small subunit
VAGPEAGRAGGRAPAGRPAAERPDAGGPDPGRPGGEPPPGEREEGGPSFEDALARLEAIVQALEAGHLSLDESLRVFEEGTGLLRFCTRRLEETERRIEILLQDEGGGARTEPFRWEEEQP